MGFRIFPAMAVAVTTTACTVLPNQNPTLPDRELGTFTADADKSEAYLSDRTFRTYNAYGKPGNRVLFLDRNGAAYFWNQASTRVDQRYWVLRKELFEVELCFADRPIVPRDDSKKKKKVRLTCTGISPVIATHREAVYGDVFNLATGRAPFDLPDDAETTFADIRKRMLQGG